MLKSDVTTVTSRAVAGEDKLRENLTLWLSKEDKVIRKYKGATSIPEKDWLPSGEYFAEAWAGDSVSATFDPNQRWFKGSARFTVSALQTTTVQIPCKISNVLVDMLFDSDLLDKLTDVKIVVGHSRGQLEFTPSSGMGYFMMPSTDKNLTWTLTATRVEDGVAIKKSGVIRNAKPATRYTLIAHANVDDSEIGGAFFGIQVDTSMKPVYDEFTVEIPPVIEAYGFTPSEGVVFKEGQIGNQAIFIIACADIASAKLTLAGLSDLLGGITDRQGNPFETIDFISVGDDLKPQIEAGGIDWEYEYHEDYQSATLKVNFRETFTNNLKEGEYEFIHEITDNATPPRTTNQTVHVRVSNALLNLQSPEPYDIWATKATVSAVAMQDEYGNVSFEYRKKGDSDWNSATATQVGDGARPSFNAVLTSLLPETPYEYRVISDIDNYVSEPLEFTTESPLQLPNAGFEHWSDGENGVKLPFDAGEDPFWDSGNRGSITLGVNVTSDDSSVKHSGDKSIKLASANVEFLGFGKFAAGNVFVGEYLKTDGTDGVLGWGRPFTSRPTALKGYIKYRTGKLNSLKLSDNIKKIPGNPIAADDNDQGIIYVAILDNSVSKTAEGKSYPVIIKTKTAELFSENDPNVLGYGQQVWTENTEGEGMIPFTIPINYDGKPHNIPSYILLTCSASRYGDYFVGSTSAEMWIDDLELVYE